LLGIFAIAACGAQAPLSTHLHSQGQRQAIAAAAATAEYPPATEVVAVFSARLSKADASQRGALWLEAEAAGAHGEKATLRAPLSGTEEAYGEERTCTEAGMTYTAGLEEANYMAFQPGAAPHAFRVLLNRLLCRLLAAPFHCGGKEVAMVTPWASWKLGKVRVVLESDGPAAAEVSAIQVRQTLTPFDHARCAVVAPSNGFCCVQGMTTEWHCGGTPVGEGWHQVSGECFHRETGGVCHD
jgi:hypothetical protein